MRKIFTVPISLLCLFSSIYLHAQKNKSGPISSGTPLSTTIYARNVSCGSLNNGAADLQVSGGMGPYTYSWSNGATTEDLSNLMAGSYSVTVKDGNNATVKACIVIVADNSFSLALSGNSEICTAGQGSVQATVTGGTAPFTYLWSNSANTSSISGLNEGTYTVLVKDATGCSKRDSIRITSLSNISLSLEKINISCPGRQNGSIKSTVTGGAAPYSFSWSNGQTTSDIQNLVSGIYSVKVTDGKGCTQEGKVTIDEPAGMVISHNTTASNCDGAFVSTSVSGGTAPYTYIWDNGDTTSNLSNIQNGGYTLTVQDAQKCFVAHFVDVTNATLMTLSGTTQEVTCSNSMAGAINLSVHGGTAPLNYLWSNGATIEDISNLSENTYSVTVTDAKGCRKTASFSVGASRDFSYELNTSDISCYGNIDGYIEVVPIGSGPFTYNWSNGETTNRIDNLTAGSYTVTVTDANGCSKIINHIINEPQQLEASTAVTNDDCDGGKINLTVKGGTAPYFFNWSDGSHKEDLSQLDPGGYYVDVIDAKGCTASAYGYVEGLPVSRITISGTDVSCAAKKDGTAKVLATGNAPFTYKWSNGSITNDILGLSPGTYSVVVEDYYGCIKNGSVKIVEPNAITGDLIKTDAWCAGGATGDLEVFVNGGTLPYTYKWSNNDTTSKITGLTAGLYSLIVTDTMGCTFKSQETIAEPASLMAKAVSSNSCKGGSIDLSVTGGKQPYSYLWSNGAASEDISGLQAGTYDVNIKDASGCETKFSSTVLSYMPIKLNLVATGGTIDLTVLGGVLPYTFLWSNGSTTEDVTGLANGTYSVIVTDANGCKASGQINVSSGAGESLTAKIDCCADKSICINESTAIPIHFTGTAPFNFTYRTGNDKSGYTSFTVTTSENPYMLQVKPSATTTYELVSVNNECQKGTVCGKATIATNYCSTSECSANCFHSEVVNVADQGDCRTVKLKVTADGTCKHALSHMVVSVPCGTVTSASNTMNYAIEKGGIDPTTQLSGFKVDNVSNFGDGKSKSTMYVTYTVCKNGAACFDDFCAPLISYKAATCVYYEKAIYVPTITNTAEAQSSMDISVYPNPIQNGKILSISLPDSEINNSEKVSIVNSVGEIVYSKSLNAEKKDGKNVLEVGVNFSSGIYMVLIKDNDHNYVSKFVVE